MKKKGRRSISLRDEKCESVESLCVVTKNYQTKTMGEKRGRRERMAKSEMTNFFHYEKTGKNSP